MFTADLLSIYQQFLLSYHVRLTLLGKLPEDLPGIDLGLRGTLFPGYPYQKMRDSILSWLEKGKVGSFRDDFGMQYLAFLCDRGDHHPEYHAGIVGPFLYEQPTPVSLYAQAEKLSLSKQSQNTLQHLLLRVPYITDRERWISTNYYLIGLLINGAAMDGVTQARTDITIYLNNYGETVQQAHQSPGNAALPMGDNLTEALLTAIRNADIRQAAPLIMEYADFMTGYHHNAGLDPYDVAIGLNALLLHTAIHAGVDAIELSNVYIWFSRQLMETRARGRSRIPYIGMASKYCALIAKYRPTHKNPLVTQTVNYLHARYRENIRLHQLAGELKVSEVYLSGLFHRETGTTIIAFLNEIRVDKAKELLENTSIPIQRIAELVGFADANYFSKVFRKSQGCSPMQYRKKLSLI